MKPTYNIDIIMKELLEKYYNGETTEQEEEKLRLWILNENVPAAFADDQRMFRELEWARTSTTAPSNSFEKRLTTLIDNVSKQETKPPCKRNYGQMKWLRWWVAGLAASIILVFSLTRHSKESIKEPQNYIHEVNNPQEADIYVNFALSKFSKAIHSGYSQIEKVNNVLEKFNNINQ